MSKRPGLLKQTWAARFESLQATIQAEWYLVGAGLDVLRKHVSREKAEAQEVKSVKVQRSCCPEDIKQDLGCRANFDTFTPAAVGSAA